MKRNYTIKTHQAISFAVFAFVLLTSLGCTDKVEFTRRYAVFEPVYMSPAEIRESFDILPPEPIKQVGKIYLYRQFILLNDPGKGIHIIDNSDPANPRPISFVKMPGNYDMAAKGDVLYADSYMDLVALDISDPEKVSVINRIEDILAGSNPDVWYDPVLGVLVDYEEKEIIEVTENESGGFSDYFVYRRDFLAMSESAFMDMAKTNSAIGGTTGIGGSMARFTISGDHLYTIDNNNLTVFDISNLADPATQVRVNVGWGIETIFPYGRNLFIGSQTGMHIYDISYPAAPEHLSTFEHVRSCDPVVVQDTLAFVTLRDGTACRADFTNQLDVLDIRNLREPKLIKSFAMFNPHGLGVDGELLFICDGDAGLKVFNISDLMALHKNMVAHYHNIHAFDVIPYLGNLIMIGEDGLYQFDYTDVQDIKLRSKIVVESGEDTE
jgi:hypothetical protein